MTKLIIFDLDGVLIDSKDMHYTCLNIAIAEIDSQYIIRHEEHISSYDGLPTKTKLQMLTDRKGLPEKHYDQILKRKQEHTIEYIRKYIKPNEELIKTFRMLASLGYKICVASNCVRQTTKQALLNLGIMSYVDYFFSNEDVNHPKPSPEIYLRAMLVCDSSPRTTLILEDSPVGRQAVHSSGAKLCPINSPEDVTIDYILSCISDDIKFKWSDKNLNVLIPMAGRGSRFEQTGYTFPKPLIEVNGKPMIQLVVESLGIDAHYIFIVQKEHYEKYNLKYVLNLIAPNCDIVQVDGITEGAACTTLLARHLIDNNKSLLIANSDQYVDWNSTQFIYSMSSPHIDAGILTFKNTHPKWSYAKLDEHGFVTEVAEKKPISDNATVGIYYWKRGCEYVTSVDEMIAKEIRVNGEFYVCPAFNEAIADKLKIKTFEIESDKMWGLGTPEDLNYFIENHK